MNQHINPGETAGDETKIDEQDFKPSPYVMQDDGLWWHDLTPPKKEGDAPKPPLKLSGHFEVAAMTRNGEGQSWGLWLKWKDADGREQQYVLKKELLVGDGKDARQALVDRGLYVTTGATGRALLNAYLNSQTSPIKALSTETTGWTGNAFVLPDRCFGANQGEEILLKNIKADHPYRSAGTLQEWQDNVAKYAVGNSRLAMAISLAFVGPLLGPCSEEGGGIHLKGSSSIGKTTALSGAASVWGRGDNMSGGFIKSWRATSNGLEAVCAGHSGTFLILDELSQIDAKAAGDAVYMLANNSGKHRLRPDGTARTTKTWLVPFLSSGEIGLHDKLAEDRQRKATAGQQIRIVDVAADAGAGLGLFEKLHGFPSGKELSKHIVAASKEFYGTAAIAFLEAIVPQIESIKDVVKEEVAQFCADWVPDGADGQVLRVAQRFGLIAAAGEIAAIYGVLPWERGTANHAAGVCFESWLVVRGHSGAAEIHDGTESIREFLQVHGMSHFEPAWEIEEERADHERRKEERKREGIVPMAPLRPAVPIRELFGFRKHTPNEGWHYYVNDAGWAAMCKGFNKDTLFCVMVDRKFMKRDHGNNRKVKVSVPNHGRARYYHITARLLNTEPDTEEIGAMVGCPTL
jgi:putative DNA primase/helicase